MSVVDAKALELAEVDGSLLSRRSLNLCIRGKGQCLMGLLGRSRPEGSGASPVRSGSEVRGRVGALRYAVPLGPYLTKLTSPLSRYPSFQPKILHKRACQLCELNEYPYGIASSRAAASADGAGVGAGLRLTRDGGGVRSVGVGR